MPVHDWTRVDGNAFHGFHLAWIAELRKALNRGGLPPGYYADAEQVAGPVAPDVLTLSVPSSKPPRVPAGGSTATAPHFSETMKARARPLPRRVAVRSSRGDRVVALIEIVSRANKDRKDNVRLFADKVVGALEEGVHVVVMDVLPPGPSDPDGMHGAIWRRFSRRKVRVPPEAPLLVAGYRSAAPTVDARVERFAVGAELPTVPLFLTPEFSVAVPAAATYAEAWDGTPEPIRETLTAPAT